MELATVANLFLGSFLLAQVSADRAVIACNLKALTAAERSEHARLSRLLAGAVSKRSPVEGGYVFSLELKLLPLPELATWVTLERKCCPFLRFLIEVTSGSETIGLTVSGGPGVKEFLESEFQLRR